MVEHVGQSKAPGQSTVRPPKSERLWPAPRLRTVFADLYILLHPPGRNPRASVDGPRLIEGAAIGSTHRYACMFGAVSVLRPALTMSNHRGFGSSQ